MLESKEKSTKAETKNEKEKKRKWIKNENPIRWRRWKKDEKKQESKTQNIYKRTSISEERKEHI